MANANFTPDIGPYTTLKPFRFWCQKVLPLVYDDSLSYYELLGKVVDYLNKTMEDVDTQITDIQGLLSAYEALQSWVNAYYTSADFAAAIDDGLDRMAESGQLTTLLTAIVNPELPGLVDDLLPEVVLTLLPDEVSSQISGTVATQLPGTVANQIGPVVGQQIGGTVATQLPSTVANQIGPVVANQIGPVVEDKIVDPVEDWLDANVSGGIAVDRTLSVLGAGADAAFTGARLASVDNAVGYDHVSDTGFIITTTEPYAFNTEFIDNNASFSDYASHTYKMMVIPVNAGDKYCINAHKISIADITTDHFAVTYAFCAKYVGDPMTDIPRYLPTAYSANDAENVIATVPEITIPTGLGYDETTGYLVVITANIEDPVYKVVDEGIRKDVSDLKDDLTVVENEIFVKYDITDLTNSYTYIRSDGTVQPTTIILSTSPMISTNRAKKIILYKKSLEMTGFSIAFYRTDQFTEASLISGYVAAFEEGTATVNIPSDAKYLAFCSRTLEGSVFDATLCFSITEEIPLILNQTEQNTANILSVSSETDMLSYFTVEEEDFIDKPDSVTSVTNPASIFAIGTTVLTDGYYNINFYTEQDTTLYLFGITDITDTSLTLKNKVTTSPINGVCVVNGIKVEETCLLAFSGYVGYKAAVSKPYYLVTYSDGSYTKPATASGNVVFNIEVKRVAQKVNESTVYGIPYIAQASEAIHIKLIGDSITQGSGSTGYVEFTLNGNIYRGNAPDYPDASPDYQVGKFLGTKETVIHWYEALDGSGWGQLIKSYFEEKFNCTVKNYGMGGATTSDILRCWDNIMDADDDIVILMMGTNDRRAHSLATYYSEMRTIVSNLLAEDKKVIVMSPPPILPTVDADSTYFHMEDACNNSSAAAYAKGCQFIDNFGYFEEHCELKGVGLNTLLNNDGIHPNDTGYRVLFNNIVRELGLGRKVNGATW